MKVALVGIAVTLAWASIAIAQGQRPVDWGQPSATDDSASNVEVARALTGAEMQGLRVAVQQCWNVGSLSSEELRVTVTVGVSLNPDGRPETSSIRLLDYSGGTDAAARNAFGTARRAIIRCGASGYDLPQEKFEQWRKVEMKFNPESMR